MGLGVFDKLWQLATEEQHEVQAVLRNFAKTNYDEQLADVEKTIDKLLESLDKKNKTHKKIQSEKNKLEKDVVKLTKKLKPIDSTIVDIKISESELEDNKDLHEQTQIEFQKSLKKISDIENNKKLALEKIEELKLENVLQKYNELESFEYEYDKVTVELDKLKEHVKHKLDKITKLDKVEYDPDCKF